MVEISNDTLALLMVAVIVVVIGAVASLTWMGAGPTGAAEYGAVNLTIESDLTIHVNTNTSFGSGHFNASNGQSNCTLYSNDSDTYNSSGSTGCWYNTTPYAPTDIEIENQGTVPMNVTLISDTNSTDMINASSGKGGWYYAVNYTYSGTCTGDADSPTAGTWTEIVSDSPTEYDLANWSAGCTQETINISFQLDLPDDVEVHNRYATLTITANAA